MKSLISIFNAIIAICTVVVFSGCGDSLCKLGIDKYCDEKREEVVIVAPPGEETEEVVIEKPPKEQDPTDTGNIQIIWDGLSTHPEVSDLKIAVYRPSYEQTDEGQTLLGDLVVEKIFPNEAKEGFLEKIPLGTDYIVLTQALRPDGTVVFEGYEEEVAVRPMEKTIVGPIVLKRMIAPLVPVNLDVSVGLEGVTLTWDEVTDASGYMLYYDTLPGEPNEGVDANEGPSPVIVEGGKAVSFLLTGLDGGEVYYFSVTAYNDVGESGYSSEVSAITIPAPPGNLTIVAGINEIELSWEGVYGADGYMVYYDTGPGEPYNGTDVAEGLSPITIMTNDIKLTGLEEDTTYYLVVSAFNENGEGYYSTEVSATTLLSDNDYDGFTVCRW